MTLTERYQQFLEDAFRELKSGCSNCEEVEDKIIIACDELSQRQGTITAMGVRGNMNYILHREGNAPI